MAREGAGKQMSGSAVRGRASGRTVDAPWGPTEIQRDYRTLTDAVTSGKITAETGL